MSMFGGMHARGARRLTYGASVVGCALTVLLARDAVAGAMDGHGMRMTATRVSYAPVIVPEDSTAHASTSVTGHPAVEVLAIKGRGWWQIRAGAGGAARGTNALGVAVRIAGLTYVPRLGHRPVGVIGR